MLQSIAPSICRRPQPPLLRHPLGSTVPTRVGRRRTRHVPTAAVQGLDQLVIDSTLPVLKIGMVAAAGAAAAHYGMLNAEARRALSKLAINVFTPALMFTKIGAHTDLASALSLWYIGANVILCHLVGLGLGMLHTKLLPTAPSLKHIIHASSAIANTGNLPLVLVLSLIKSPNLPFNSAAQAEAAVSYIMLGLGFATLVQMPLGTLLLHKPKQEEEQEQVEDSSAAALAASHSHSSVGLVSNNVLAFSGGQPLLGSFADLTTAATTQQQALGAGHASGASRVATLDRPTSLVSLQLQMQHSMAVKQCQHASHSGPGALAGAAASISSAGVLTGSSTSRAAAARLPVHQQQPSQQPTGPTSSVWPGQYTSRPIEQPQQQQQPVQAPHLQLQAQEWFDQRFGDWWQQHREVLEPLMKGVLSPPLIAGVLAVMVGSCPPLQAALFSPRGSLSVVADVLDLLGQPLIPVLLLVLGANLSNGPQLESGAHLPPLNVAGVIASKLIVSPIIGLAVVLGAQRVGLLGATPDPLAVLVMMVTWSTPTAILVHSLALVHKNGEDEVSALLFYEYVAAALTLPLCSAVYLYVLGCCVSQVA